MTRGKITYGHLATLELPLYFLWPPSSQGQGTKKVINKYQCGNDLDFSPLLNNADKYARFDNPNCYG